jgi:hypothetical protein
LVTATWWRSGSFPGVLKKETNVFPEKQPS